MDILVLGAGIVGKTIVHDLSTDFDITVGDINPQNLLEIEDLAKTLKIDIKDEKNILSQMREHDLIIGALPGRFGFKSLELALEGEVDIVDVSFMPEDPLELDDKAKRAGTTVIADAGFGPGMSNVFAGKITEEMDKVDRLKIWIGSLPQEPQPPLYYKLTWSPRDLIEEYTRPARIITDGEIIDVDPLEEIEKNIIIDDMEFEGFLSDGLRTLLDTLEVENMEEITLRWEGHLEKFKVLRELGFFDEKNIDLTIDVIKDHMRYDTPDFSIMDVVGEGIKDGQEERIRYFFYDEEEEFSSIARTTGYSTAAISRLFIEKDFRDGVIPPEEFGRDEGQFNFLIDFLSKKGIKIKKESSFSF